MRVVRLGKAAREHKTAIDKLNAEIGKRDQALANLAAEHRRQQDAKDLRHVNALNTLHELHGLHTADLEQRRDIALKGCELTARQLSDRIDSYKAQRDAAQRDVVRIRSERDALRIENRTLQIDLARDRTRALFPGSAPL